LAEPFLTKKQQDAGEKRLEEALRSRMMQYIDKNVFLHRLYISLNTQFATNQVGWLFSFLFPDNNFF
jgi:hypothetical protein